MAPAGRPLHHGVPDVRVAPVPLQTSPFAVDEMESRRLSTNTTCECTTFKGG
jgi:hypothetical protein